MLDKNTFEFLKQLQKNNNKEWFEGHRKEYEAIRKSAQVLVEALLKEISAFDPEVARLEAKNCMFRINRDVRFSKDKSPYKTNLGLVFNPDGKKSGGPAYYLHLEPGKSFVGGGMYDLTPEELKRIRQEIDYNGKDFKAIVEAPAFKKTFGKLDGEQLKTTPKGYEPDNPMIDYLRYKQYLAGAAIADEVLLDPKKAVKEVATIFKTLHPLFKFLRSN